MSGDKSTYEGYLGLNGSLGVLSTGTYAYYDVTLKDFTFQAEEHHQEGDHQWPADELGGSEAPAHENDQSGCRARAPGWWMQTETPSPR